MEDYEERLQILEATIHTLAIHLLSDDAFRDLNDHIKLIKEIHWERRMGDDL